MTLLTTFDLLYLLRVRIHVSRMVLDYFLVEILVMYVFALQLKAHNHTTFNFNSTLYIVGMSFWALTISWAQPLATVALSCVRPLPFYFSFKNKFPTIKLECQAQSSGNLLSVDFEFELNSSCVLVPTAGRGSYTARDDKKA